ncbi:MAG TPA: outer membrane beta-barrel protein [candidate division Zixibacteria bacterium]|nr:outer membrane beta-barrel protein [candidate division Zixibacteria bacterium]
MRRSPSVILTTIFSLSLIPTPALSRDWPDFDPPAPSQHRLAGSAIITLSSHYSFPGEPDTEAARPTPGLGIGVEYFLLDYLGMGYHVSDTRYRRGAPVGDTPETTVNTYMFSLRLLLNTRERWLGYVRFELGGATGTRPPFLWRGEGNHCRDTQLPHSRDNNPAAGYALGVMFHAQKKIWLSAEYHAWTVILPVEYTVLAPEPYFGYYICRPPFSTSRGLDFSAKEARISLMLRL